MARMSVIWTKQAPGRGEADKGASKQASLGMNRAAPAWVAYPCTLFIPDRFGLPRTLPLYARGRVRHSRRAAGCVLRRKCQCRTAVPRTPKHSGQAHQPAIERRPGMVPAGAPHSPKRSSTVHTSARRPPGAGEARSGALQERPARKSRACTYSRPSALAWATSSLSVGERSKASMISAAKTEERRSTSMAKAQARGATPTNRLSSAQIAYSQVAKGLLPRKERRRRGARHSGLHRVRPGRVPDQFKPHRRPPGGRPLKEPVSDNLSFCTPSLLKHSVTFSLGSKLNLAGPGGGQDLETPRGSGDRFFDHSAQAPGPVWGRRKMQGSLQPISRTPRAPPCRRAGS